MKLNLGSGFRKQHGYINIDNRPETYPDLLCNIENGLPYDDGKVDEIRAVDFLEHLHQDKVIFVIEEIWRVLKNNGLFYSRTPSTESRGAWQDPTHRSYWNLNSWYYWSDDEYRKLIGTKAKFQGEVQDIVTDQKMHVIHTEATMYAVK
ncbi:MAG TPA: methyltransferase domain-containing protein [Pricia sp.]|nr:methyltransferase domain-containing protein [Pricia sp.]